MKLPRAPKLKKPKLEAPGFLGDLFRDLRDRRLLLPALALVAGLIAVPALLANSDEPAPPPAPPAADSGAAEPTSAAVLAGEQVGVRDYRKRLDQLKSKNPFEQQFPLPDVSESDDLDVSDAGITGDAGSTGSTGSTAGTGDTSATPPATADPGSGGDDTSSPKPPESEPRYFTWRIDVKVGRVGDTGERSAGQLDLLPSENRPVVVFLGVVEGGGEAVFAVSEDVTDVEGSGRCAPNPGNCRYIVLREHEYGVFDYAVDGERYRLQLQRIRVSRIDNPAKVAGKF